MRFFSDYLLRVVCFRDAIGRFPDYPTVEEGGCLELFKERDPAEIAAELKLLVSGSIKSRPVCISVSLSVSVCFSSCISMFFV